MFSTSLGRNEGNFSAITLNRVNFPHLNAPGAALAVRASIFAPAGGDSTTAALFAI